MGGGFRDPWAAPGAASLNVLAELLELARIAAFAFLAGVALVLVLTRKEPPQ